MITRVTAKIIIINMKKIKMLGGKRSGSGCAIMTKVVTTAAVDTIHAVIQREAGEMTMAA